MANLTHKIKMAMDESRMLILGAQVLVGFQYRAPFETGFQSLPALSQYLGMASLVIMLTAVALILSPGPYHRIVWRGTDSQDIHDFTSRVMDIALFPFLTALGIVFYVVVGKFLGTTGGIAVGALISGAAFCSWYGPGIILGKRQRNSQREGRASMQRTPLKDRIEQVLTEARVVLPGVQALLGFQLVTMLMEGFDKLPQSSKYVHLISLVLMGLTSILLMTPAAYHRIVERGEDSESFHRVASTLLLLAMVPLPIGMCGELYVVIRKVADSIPLALGSAILLLLFFYGLWFGFTAYRRARLAKAAP